MGGVHEGALWAEARDGHEENEHIAQPNDDIREEVAFQLKIGLVSLKDVPGKG